MTRFRPARLLGFSTAVVLLPMCAPTQCAPREPVPAPAAPHHVPAAPADGDWLRLPTVWSADHLERIDNSPGSQAAIDAGHVVNWSGCWPEGECTVGFAGHRTTHGAVFREAPHLRVGDLVEVIRDGETITYRVTATTTVCCYGDAVNPTGDLLITTSAPGRRVHYIEAERIS